MSKGLINDAYNKHVIFYEYFSKQVPGRVCPYLPYRSQNPSLPRKYPLPPGYLLPSWISPSLPNSSLPPEYLPPSLPNTSLPPKYLPSSRIPSSLRNTSLPPKYLPLSLYTVLYSKSLPYSLP